MLKGCSYCGGIYDSQYICPKKPKREYKITDIDRFRWAKAWQRKQINERDGYMCQVCIRNIYLTQLQCNYKDIGVHHIVSIAEEWGLRLEDSNLICLCDYHHRMTERKEIPGEELINIANQQENEYYA
ncbi:HNH endonuclease [Clostridium sp. Marseille-Q7071]